MAKLTGQDQHTYDAVFRHPVSGNIEWHGLLALFEHIGEVVSEPNGKVKFARNGQSITLHPSGKDAEMEVVIDIRRFLKKSEKPIGPTMTGTDFLVVLDHAEARVYRTESPDAKPVHIEPYDPLGEDKHVHNSHENARPHTSALHHEFFEKIAFVLEGADKILVFGDGQGSSRESDGLMEDLKRHHSELAERVIGAVSMNLSHMTEGELLAKAREQFAGSPAFVA